MKTFKNIFGQETKKSITNFSGNLNFNSMLQIKGGQDDDLWAPPIPMGDDSGNGATSTGTGTNG